MSLIRHGVVWIRCFGGKMFLRRRRGNIESIFHCNLLSQQTRSLRADFRWSDMIVFSRVYLPEEANRYTDRTASFRHAQLIMCLEVFGFLC